MRELLLRATLVAAVTFTLVFLLTWGALQLVVSR